MTSSPVRQSRRIAKLDSSFYVVILVCLVAALSYLAAALGGVLVLRPQMVWPLWPGCAFLVAVLLLTPRRLWPALLTAGLAGFVLYDARAGLTIRATSWLILSDVIEILIAALGVRYLFGGVPSLTSLKSLAKYSLLALILAPISAASFGWVALGGDYRVTGGISFLTEALALLTLTPAILSWVDTAAWAQESRAYYLEAVALIAGLVALGYITFVASGGSSRPALLYSLVPFLLWSALRFGIKGSTNSMLIVAFLSIWGAVHGRGPFTGPSPLNNVLSLQLFLLFAATTFMVLAALADEHKQSAQAVRESERRFRLVANAAPVLIWMSGTDKLCTYFNKPWLDFTGRSSEQEFGNGWAEGVHPEDLQRCLNTYTQSFDRREKFKMEYRLRRYDGEFRWVLDAGVPRFNEDHSFAGYIGVAIDVTDRREGEQSLQEINRELQQYAALLQSREELLKTFVKNVPAGVAMFDRDMRYLQASDRWCADYSIDSSQMLGRSHYDIFPDMPERWKDVHRRGLQGETLRADEDRWDGRDGPHWARWEVRPWTTPEGIVGGILILAEDITRRKQMEEALSTMSRKLIQSQEQERARIGRELHDDINQRLAMLAVELGQLQDNPFEVGSRLQELRKQTTEISNDVQALSHELHSSKLEYLGVVAGIKSWCREFGERQRMEVEFKSDVVSVLPLDLGVCFLRVLQEALHNAVKHSGTKRVEVQLAEHSNEVHLSVRDSGRGFDIEEAKQGRGLGLTSMQERVRLVSGDLSIESRPQRGTTIHARVPLGSDNNSERAVG